jgi:hypothetical protein
MDDNSWLEDAVRVAGIVPATSGQRWAANVQLSVVVPVMVLACSGIAPGLQKRRGDQRPELCFGSGQRLR